MTQTVQTSNYARHGGNATSIAISATIPKWYTGKWMKTLAPEWWMVKAIIDGEIDVDEYYRLYLNCLIKDRNLTPTKILSSLPDQCFLLCYEAPGDECHRRVLADWITLETGLAVPEWMNEKETKIYNQTRTVENLLDF